MMTVAEQKALRAYRDSILSTCRESTAFASLAADALVGLCACGAAVYLVCVFVRGAI